ncbi:MAG: hypothetical protein ACFE9C_00175 [Candidatus Hodarchaeota archaeon]
MVSINAIKEKLWLISIIAGILGIITIFTPVWGYLYGSYFGAGWLWALYIENGEPSLIPFDEPIVPLGIATMLIIAVGACLLLVGGILAKKRDKGINLFYLIGGILPLVGIIIYMAGVASFYSGWWTFYSVHVGTILAYIAGGLGITAGVIGIMEKRKS